MRYAFFTNTPAHVHLFRHAVDRLRGAGHDVVVLGREYGVTKRLLSYYDLPFRIYGRTDASQFSLARRLPRHFLRIRREMRQFDPDVVFGMGAYAAVGGLFAGAPSVIVVDSEPDPVDHAVSKRLVDAMLSPHPFRKDLGPSHYTFRGFKECAYLHPDVFEPDPSIRSALGIGPAEPYAVLRLNAFGAHHDLQVSGFTAQQRRELVARLSEHLRVFVSDEGDTFDFAESPATQFDPHPARFHDALAEADLVVADTQTVVTEAALLGTPAVRSNSFVGEDDMGNFLELEEQGLVENYQSYEAARDRAVELAGDPEAVDRWRHRRDQYVGGLVDLTDLLVDVAKRPDRVESDGRLRSGGPTEADSASVATSD